MLLSATILFCCTAILVLVYIYEKWTSYRVFRAAAIQHGCKRPPKFPHRDQIWGTDLLKLRMKAAEEGRQSKFGLELFNTIGTTFEENFLGTKVYNTTEVQNLQQVGTTAFNDYGKPAVAFFMPFLGEGIFSLDGAPWKHSRDLIKPIFSRSEISDVNTLGIHVDRFLDKIPCDGTTIDLQPLVHNLVGLLA